MIKFFVNVFNMLYMFMRTIYLLVISFFYRIPQYALLLYFIKKKELRSKILNRLGHQLVLALTAFGPTFIKLGQAISTRSDVIGPILSSHLSKLQDAVPQFSPKLVEQILIDHDIINDFNEFNYQSVAAASVAQVHKGKLIDGTNVAVKILRPNIENKLKRDICFFNFLLRIIKTLSFTDKLNLKDIITQLEKITALEVDLRLEAASSSLIASNLKNDNAVVIPEIIWSMTAKNIMVSRWVDGIPIKDIKTLKENGFDLLELARKIAVMFFNQAYRDGTFHADLHPGNIMITKDGKIALVDFGIIGVLKEDERIFLAKMLYAFLKRDYDLVAKLHFDIGYVKGHDPKIFAIACRSIGEPCIGQPLYKTSIAKLLKQLLDVAKQFDMEIQPQLLLLQKTMLTVEGIGYGLCPQINMWQLAEPWIEEWAKKHFGIKATAINIKSKITAFVEELQHLFQKIDTILTHTANLHSSKKD